VIDKLDLTDETTPVSDEQIRRAQLKVCSFASSAEDARTALSALGLLPAEEKPTQDYHYELCVKQLHRLTPNNTEIGDRGGRRCKTCRGSRPENPGTCSNGHPQIEENRYMQPSGIVRCAICRRQGMDAAHAKRMARGGKSSKSKFCVNGHEWTPENTKFKSNGHRQCADCYKESVASKLYG
jgi:hypothetical protein